MIWGEKKPKNDLGKKSLVDALSNRLDTEEYRITQLKNQKKLSRMHHSETSK